MFTLAELENVIPLVRASVPPTPQYAWPLLKAHTGVEIVVKHENHTPIGAFKVRGGIVYFDRLKRERPQVRGIVTATRGNHGRSLAFAGARAGVAVTVLVPLGNSTDKNAAMRALGAELIEHGRDFDEARERALRSAAQRNLEYAPAFHRNLVLGVATYAHELFTAVDDIDTVYVPIGMRLRYLRVDRHARCTWAKDQSCRRLAFPQNGKSCDTHSDINDSTLVERFALFYDRRKRINRNTPHTARLKSCL